MLLDLFIDILHAVNITHSVKHSACLDESCHIILIELKMVFLNLEPLVVAGPEYMVQGCH